MKGFLVLNLGFILTASFASANVAVIEALSTRVSTAVKVNAPRVDVGALSRINAAASLAVGANQAVVANLQTIANALESVEVKNNGEVNGINKERRYQALLNAYIATINSQGNADFLKVINGEFLRSLTAVGAGVTSVAFQQLERFVDLVANGSSPEDAATQATPGSLAELANRCGGTAQAASALR